MFKKSMKTLILVVVIIALSGFTFAFAAANTVADSRAGDGVGAVAGYDVTSVVYTLNATNPANIDSVAFTLNFSANLVKVQLVTNGTWYSCAGTTSITCTTTGATVALANTLRVVASSN